jgi:toxin ParE1/3/4
MQKSTPASPYGREAEFLPRLRYSDASKDDLKRIARFIAQDKPVAARQWSAKVRQKCRLVSEHPETGDPRPELGEGIRSTYLGRYVIYFRHKETVVEIVRVIPGDRDTQAI